MRRLAPAAIAALLIVATGCLPAAPSVGRPGPISKVELIGDSVSWGLFGTTPWVRTEMEQRMYVRRMSFSMDGGPAENAISTFTSPTPWVDRLAARIAADDPDVIVIQSSLFDGATDPAKQEAYRTAFTALVDVARSRDAHVYVVFNHTPPDPKLASELAIAQWLQAEVIAGRGISTIPMAEWMDRCPGGYIGDGVHLTDAGTRCYANALTAAIDQLRKQVG